MVAPFSATDGGVTKGGADEAVCRASGCCCCSRLLERDGERRFSFNCMMGDMANGMLTLPGAVETLTFHCLVLELSIRCFFFTVCFCNLDGNIEVVARESHSALSKRQRQWMSNQGILKTFGEGNCNR